MNREIAGVEKGTQSSHTLFLEHGCVILPVDHYVCQPRNFTRPMGSEF